MKRQVLAMQGVRSVISVFVLFLISLTMVQAQEQDYEIIAEEEYNLINDFFSDPRNNEKIPIYYRTYYDKSWMKYFSRSGVESMTDKVGIPTSITDSQLDSILSEEILRKISNTILVSRPIELDPSKLNDDIKLIRSFDSKRNLEEGVFRISKPIIVNDIAILRMVGFDEAPIYIMRKNGNKWDIIYTFHDWLILE